MKSKTEFNKEVCDIKHDEIKLKLSEIKKLSYLILTLVVGLILADSVKGDTSKVATMITYLLKIVGV